MSILAFEKVLTHLIFGYATLNEALKEIWSFNVFCLDDIHSMLCKFAGTIFNTEVTVSKRQSRISASFEFKHQRSDIRNPQ